MAPPAGPSFDVYSVQPAESTAGRRTPTPAGYLAAGALAVAMFGISVGITLGASMVIDGGAGVTGAITAALTYGFGAGVAGAVAAAAVGLPLSMVAHAALTSVRSQAVHVATFGLVGVLAAVALLALFGFLGWEPVAWFLIGAAGSCTALSRFVVGRRQGLRSRPRTPSPSADQKRPPPAS